MTTSALESTCQHQQIGISPLGNVTFCPHCAVVHVAIGHVSLRFTSEAFRDLRDLVSRAQAKLDPGPAPEPAQRQQAEPAAIPSFVMPPVGRIQ